MRSTRPARPSDLRAFAEGLPNVSVAVSAREVQITWWSDPTRRLSVLAPTVERAYEMAWERVADDALSGGTFRRRLAARRGAAATSRR